MTTCKCNAFQCIRLTSLNGRGAKVSSFRSFARIPSWCRKPQSFAYHVCAEDITNTVFIPYLSEEDRQALEEEGVIPPESSVGDRFCVMCPVKRGSPRLLPCCLCNNWCHIGCSYQTHLGRICPCHVRILNPKRKLIVMTHPYHADYGQICEDTSASRWSPSSWVNLLLEKHAWLSAGLVWMHGASDSHTKGVYEDSGPEGLESRPTISFFELWEKGSHLFKLVVGRNYTFPKSLVVPCAWTHSSKSLSLRDAVRNVSHHEERQGINLSTSIWKPDITSQINLFVHLVPF